MFISFKVGNYLSFKDTTEFSMVAESLIDKKETHTFPIDVEDKFLLKTAAIYGPNGSGKSNLLKAIEFALNFIHNSAKETQAEDEIPVRHFKLSTLTENQPSFFELELLVHDIKYRYGFKVTTKNVVSEWLFMTKKFKEYQLFNRENLKFQVDPKFSEAHDIEGKTRSNTLFLSAVAQWNGKISVSILETIKRIKFFNDISDSRDFSHTTELLEDSNYSKAILDFLKSADLGIINIKTEVLEVNQQIMKLLSSQAKNLFQSGKFPQLKSVKTSHKRYNENNEHVSDVFLDLASEESLGTQKLFSLAGPIIDALWNGKVLIIDEFTSRMHPLLTRFIIQKFNSSHGSYNQKNAQLIFASHNFGIMERELFRRDQIFLIRKNKQSATQITTFFKEKVRHDTSFRKQYFSKGFGAKPDIKDFGDETGEQLDLFQPPS